MIIDIHAHMAYDKIFPKFFLDGTIEDLVCNFTATGSRNTAKDFISSMMKKALSDIKCKSLVKQMEEANIDKTVLLIADLGYGTEDEAMSIDDIYKVHRDILLEAPDKFIIFAGIDPRRGTNGVELFTKGIVEYGFKGLKLYPPCGFSLQDQNVLPLLEQCRKYRLPVLMHTGPSLKNMYEDNRYIQAITKIASEFRDVIFIAAHATYSDFKENVALAGKMDNVYLDISAFQNEISQDSLLKKLYILSETIPDKILFGTDWPMYILSGKQKRWVDFIIESKAFSEDKLEKLFYKNSVSVLKLDS